MGQTTDEQHYSLKWSDYHHNMMTSFRELQDQEEFVDVTISADGLSMQAHKVVLSACSPYFRKLLKSNPCQHPIVILQNVSPASLESLLRFMYNGEVQVSHEQLSDFLRTAELLQVKGLSETGFKHQQMAAPAPMPEADSLSGRRSADSLPSPSAKRARPAPEVSTPTPSVPLPPSITAIPTSVLTAAGAVENNNHKPDPAAEQLRRLEEERERAERAAPPPLHQHHHQQQHQQHQEKYGLERLSGMDKYPALEKLSSNMEKLGGMGSLLGLPGFGGGLHQTSPVNHMQTGPSPDQHQQHQQQQHQQHQQHQQQGFRRGMDMFRLRATDPRPCNICGKIYKNAHTLRTHMEDKHSQCAGFRCVLCGTVAKSRNSLHSHMSRQHRGISTRDLPLLPMPAPWDPELAARFIARSGGRGEVVRQSVSRWEKSMSSSPVPSPVGAGGQENGASSDADPYRVNLMHQLAAQAVTSAAGGGTGANGGTPAPTAGGGGGGGGPPAPGSTGSAVLDTYLQMMAEQGLDLSVGVAGARRPPSAGAPPAGSDDEEEPEEAEEADDGDKEGSDRSDEPDNGDKENASCSGGTSDRDGSD
ncbi:zinc finger and BTB domain-containing protein 7B-like [Amphibalanus amphitrite]|uniref:zinc finger and BTB domain-containing protein 7B-like n=1 Tax=Amphibalanus amphitrite TaxID=1232801 RepID=UPI001C91C47F|nr:zinc finger and BTB domain-containing protein 7B-like [Amphibalanus amphitrite]XP_043220586.1 zinc finger and BTB domain-containing protein 7B-like [Amphibalanus amphitrite]XP_043220587.1 zinc finger and BTB domain-containing protein 7B-like [Amphibalanus amphitrite]